VINIIFAARKPVSHRDISQPHQALDHSPND